MVRAGIAELKASLSEYLRRVKAGEEVIVTEHGRPIARLAPIERTNGPTDSELDELVAAGILSPPKRPLSKEELAELRALRVQLPPGASVLEALLEEREEAW
ncbi:MAG: type II toxin-antitoxin system prevent-host-death family antitoxin [Chloroflexota bacterium]|nr:MAG: type II toxin-antitoxin system prevent-host-death family antitoxin [Chloroflexota bacterium]